MANRNSQVAVGLDFDNGCRAGAALVDGDFLGDFVQVAATLEECSGGAVIALGTQQKIDGTAVLFYRSE